MHSSYNAFMFLFHKVLVLWTFNGTLNSKGQENLKNLYFVFQRLTKILGLGLVQHMKVNKYDRIFIFG